MILISQIIAEYEQNVLGGSTFIRACRFIITLLAAGILLGLFIKSMVNRNIIDGIRYHKHGLP